MRALRPALETLALLQTFLELVPLVVVVVGVRVRVGRVGRLVARLVARLRAVRAGVRVLVFRFVALTCFIVFIRYYVICILFSF